MDLKEQIMHLASDGLTQNELTTLYAMLLNLEAEAIMRFKFPKAPKNLHLVSSNAELAET